MAAGLPAKGLGTNYANVLGTSHVKVIDMANAYATIAAKGQRVTPYFVTSVTGGPGAINYTAKPVKKAAFDKDAMADTTDAMQQPVKDGTAVVRPEPRPSRRGQDGHDDRQQGGLVRRVHPTAGDGGRHLQHRQERPGAVDEQHPRRR